MTDKPKDDILNISRERKRGTNKLSRKKEYFLVLDTETCNTLEQPLPYDIGWVICDRYGQVYEKHSFIVADVFCDMADVMQSAYYAEKIPKYQKELKVGIRKLSTMWNIRKVMLDDMRKYNVKKVGAYNMAFDKKALNTLIRYNTKSKFKWWFPYGTQYFCIWSMACETILNRTSYINFALHNNLLSEKNNIQTSAECAYRYVIDKCDFIESHTALEDVLIEVEVMAYCYRQHKVLKNKINPACWQIVQKKRKELGAKKVFA